MLIVRRTIEDDISTAIAQRSVVNMKPHSPIHSQTNKPTQKTSSIASQSGDHSSHSGDDAIHTSQDNQVVIHKRPPHGITSMKKYNFDVGEEHKDYILKYVGKALRQFRIDAGKCVRGADGNINLKPPTKYEKLIKEEHHKAFLEQNDTPLNVHVVDFDVPWVDSRKNKDIAIDNEQVQEVTNHIVSYPKRKGMRASDTE
ncbi:hypothetical protein Lal_00015781 [Lupinus albus]|nr:hypothetical protein Lal_00015781 [Lupinus albus]